MDDAQRASAEEYAAHAYRLMSSAQRRLSHALEELEHWMSDPERTAPAVLAGCEDEAGAARAELSAGTIAAGYAYTGALMSLWRRQEAAVPAPLRIVLGDGHPDDLPILGAVLADLYPEEPAASDPAGSAVSAAGEGQDQSADQAVSMSAIAATAEPAEPARVEEMPAPRAATRWGRAL